MARSWGVALVGVLGCALVAGTGACGGGGGGAPAGDVFAGEYFYGAWGGNMTGPMNVAQWGTLTADGMGMVTGGTASTNLNGGLLVGSPVPPFGYTVAAGNRITLNPAGGALEGGLAPGGDLLALGMVTASSQPFVAVLGRKGSGYGLGSLSGPYHLAVFFWNAANEVSWRGQATFDGAGSITAAVGANLNGSVSAISPPNPFGTYSVAPDGGVTWSLGANGFVGGILAGGDVVVLSGSNAANNLQLLAAFVPVGAGLGLGTLSGTYHFVRIVAGNAPPPTYASLTGVLDFDGAGTVTVGDLIRNEDGTVTPIPAGGGAAAYTVAADGSFAIPLQGVVGGVAASGNVAVVSGGTAGGSDPELWILHR